MQYRASLDGLRALCAGAVFIFHASYARGGGFIGVDVFFVLSGYLITRILLEDVDRFGAIRYRRFYIRRVRRLLPAVFVALVLVLFLWPWVGHGGSFRSILPPVLLYYVNWRIAFGHPIPALPHFWSLSTEEQFYLVWPIALSGLARLRRTYLGVAIGALVTLFATARLVATHAGPTIGPLFGYYSTFARADQLLLGALAAVLHASPDMGQRDGIARLARQLVWPATIVLSLCLVAGRIYSDWYLQGGFTGIGVVAALLVVHCAGDEPTRFNRFLRAPVLVALGKRAYGLYVFHLPLIHATEGWRTHGIRNWFAVTAARAAATIAVAWLSYHFVESRFLAPRQPAA